MKYSRIYKPNSRAMIAPPLTAHNSATRLVSPVPKKACGPPRPVATLASSCSPGRPLSQDTPLAGRPVSV